MKTLLLIVSLAALGGVGCVGAQPPETPSAKGTAAALETLIAAQERESWETIKRHDPAGFARLCLDNIVEIWGDGQVLTLPDILAQEPDTEISEYRMEDIKVSLLNDLTAVIRYRIFVRQTYKGKESPAHWMLASCVWVKRGESWKAALYQETPMPGG